MKSSVGRASVPAAIPWGPLRYFWHDLVWWKAEDPLHMLFIGAQVSSPVSSHRLEAYATIVLLAGVEEAEALRVKFPGILRTCKKLIFFINFMDAAGGHGQFPH